MCKQTIRNYNFHKLILRLNGLTTHKKLFKIASLKLNNFNSIFHWLVGQKDF